MHAENGEGTGLHGTCNRECWSTEERKKDYPNINDNYLVMAEFCDGDTVR